MDCGPDTFEPACGASACCFPMFIPQPVMQCLDATPEDCVGLEGVSKPGKFCGPDNVQCPDYDCLYHTGDCFAAHAGAGCEDAFCCDIVCDAMTGDPTCCSNVWDNACAQDALNKCDQPLQNDSCVDAKAISNAGVTGVFPFENTDATTDGPVHLACSTLGGDEQITKDVWFCWTANCTTQVLARTCGTTVIDSKIAVYEGCTCRPSDQRLRDCDDDRCGAAQSMAAFDAVAGQQYLIRVGSYPGLVGGVGSLTISCGPPNQNACPSVGGESCCSAHEQNVEACGDETCCETVCLCDPFCCSTEWDAGCAGNGYGESGCGAAQLCEDVCATCPAGSISWIAPLSGTIDGRRPYPPNAPSVLEGFKNFVVEAPSGSHRTECWDLCETDSVPGFPNAIESILDDGRGRYTVRLVRPITAGAVTTLTHVGSGASGTFISHPANVNSDSAALPSDIIDLIDHLNGIRTCPGTQTPCPLQPWQCDIDRTGACLPADIINLIDLLTGINGYRVWNGTTRPAIAGVCP